MARELAYGLFSARVTLRMRVDFDTAEVAIEHERTHTQRVLEPDELDALQRIIEPIRGADDRRVRDQFANGCEQVELTDGEHTVRWVFETDGPCGQPTMTALWRWAWAVVRRA